MNESESRKSGSGGVAGSDPGLLSDGALLDGLAAARFLGVNPRMIRRLAQDRKLGSVKVGRYVRFRQADLEQYVESNRRASYDETSGSPRRYDRGAPAGAR